MIIRQLKQAQYEQLQRELNETAKIRPLDVSYTVDLNINNIAYEVKIQLARSYRVAVLQAIEINKMENRCNIIENGHLLSIFLEILLFQKTR